MIRLGSKVKDSISGYEGIASGRAIYLNGCATICIEGPLAKDEKGVVRQDTLWVDEQRVQTIQEKAFVSIYDQEDLVIRGAAGGPVPVPPTDGAQ